MAISQNEIQVEWSGSDSQSVSSGGSNNSDTATLSATAIKRGVLLKADNGGTPAAGDDIHFYALVTTGDPDADPDSADEFSSDGYGIPLAVVKTDVDDPALVYAELPLAISAVQIRAESQAGSNSITVSAQILEVLNS